MPEEGQGALVKTSDDGNNNKSRWRLDTSRKEETVHLTVVFPHAVEITSLVMTDANAPFTFQASYIPAREDEYVPYKDGKLDPEVRCNLSYEYKLIYCYKLLSCNLLNSFQTLYHRY